MDGIVDDATRFERTFNQHYGAIAAYLLRRCASREDAEDAATEVFAVAWRRIADLPPEPEDRLWLFGVARRVLANQARAGRRRERLWHRLIDRSAPLWAPAEDAAPPVGGWAISRALRSLSASDRELLTLVAWDGLEVAEIARVLGVGAPVVSRRLHRARGRFERALAEAGGQRAADLPLTPAKERSA